MIGNRLIPEFFAGQPIKYRFPYTMPGELVVPANASGVQFPANAFLHNVDKPFEMWRMTARVTGMIGATADVAAVIDTQPFTLEQRVRLSVLDVSKNERITKNPQLISSMQKLNERTWEWDPRPYTIIRQEGMQVTCQSDAYPSVCAPDLGATQPTCDLVPTPITFVRVEVVFQGWLLILEPPSADR